MSPWKAFFTAVNSVLDFLAMSLDSFLEFHLPIYIFHVFLHVVFFSISVLNILIKDIYLFIHLLAGGAQGEGERES